MLDMQLRIWLSHLILTSHQWDTKSYYWIHCKDEKTEVHQEVQWITQESRQQRSQALDPSIFIQWPEIPPIMFSWHKISIRMTVWSNEKGFIWGATFVCRLFFSWLLINVAFPWRDFFPPSSTQTGRNSRLSKEKKYCQACLSLSSPTPGMQLYHMSPEVFVLQTNQVQMVFASSDIVGRKAFVVIYWDTFWTKS